jgi:hypothetical protein
VRRASVAVVAALAIVAAGCGGSSGGERLGRDAYLSQADAICREVTNQRLALPVPAAIEDIAGYVDRALPLLDSARSNLRALRPPPQLDDEVAAWLDAINEERDTLSDLRDAARTGDAAKVGAVGSKGTSIEQRARARALAIGLVDCATS